MTEEIKRYLEKAQKSLKVAQALLAKGYYEDSCSKSYYVMFYAAQALLKNNGIDVTKHSAVVAKFGEHFVKTGKIEPSYHRYIIDAKQKREIADYDVFLRIDRKTAEERFNWAKDFLAEIKKLIKNSLK
jgi:uncharacterized protein (UPF0332 family)